MAPLHGNIIRCDYCGVIIYKEWQQKHRQSCKSLEDSHLTATHVLQQLNQLKHSFIRDGTLYGVISDDNIPGIPDASVLIHPAVMTMCELSTRSPVIVRGRDAETLGFAWPSPSMKKMNISFPKNSRTIFKPGEPVCMIAHKGKIFAADKVELSVRSPVIADSEKEFKEFIFRKLCNLYVCSGSVYNFYFSGAKCVIEVKEISAKVEDECGYSCRTTNKSSCGSNLSALASNLSDLKLDDTASSVVRDGVDRNSSVSQLTPIDQTSSEFFTPNSSFCEQESSVTVDDTLNSSFPVCDRTDMASETYFYVTASTGFDLGTTKHSSESGKRVSFDSIFGLQEQIKKLQDLFLDRFLNEEVNFHHGILLHGPSGTGKSTVISAMSDENDLPVVKVLPSHIYANYVMYGKNELRLFFTEAKKKQPSMIFLKDIDILCEMFQNNKGGLISSLTDLIDELRLTRSRVLVLASANDFGKVDPTLKYPGRLDIDVKFSLPNSEARLQALINLMSLKDHSLTKEHLELLAESTHSLSYTDLQQICMEAEFDCARFSDENKKSDQKCHSSKLCYEDLASKLRLVKPQVIKNNPLTIQKVHWNDIGGMREVKEKLRQVVELPLKYPALFKRFGISASRGVLLYGPPGCSKTMIAKALATESSLNFVPVKGPELFSKWVGESEKAVRDLFKRAKEAAPCILFFDEIDALVGERGSTDGSDAEKRVVTQLLTEVDGAEQLEGVIIIAATNRPDILDPAMVRPGRLDHLIYVPLPDTDTRREIFQLKFKTMPVSECIDVESLVTKTEDYSGAEITAVCHEAALLALSENWPKVTDDPIIRKEHLVSALKLVQPRIAKETIQFYEAFNCSMNFKT